MGNCASAPAASNEPAPQKVTGQKAPLQQAAPPAQAPQHSGSGKLLSLQSASSLQARLDGSKSDSIVPPAAPAVADLYPTLPPVAAKPLTPPDGAESRKSFEQSHKAMVRDSLAQALELPYSIFESGPYPPPCQAERVAYSNSLGLTGSPPPDPQVAHILTSLSRVFNTDSVLLTLCGEQRVWIRNAIGFSAGEFPWRWAFCGWSLAPPSPQVLVIEDTLRDARFRDNVVVQGEPRIRFFVGAPLVASNGHRLGTLCYLGPQPRVTTAQEAMILANMAELVVRELEKDAVQSATEQAEKDDTQTGPVTRYMMRSVACFQQQGVAFVDTQLCPAWQALHCNLALSNETGVSYDAAVSCPFWELFQPPFELGSEPWRAMMDVAERAGEFAIRGCTLPDAPHRGSFTITFRPADRTALDDDMQTIGVPSDVPSDTTAQGRYFFAILSSDSAPSTSPSSAGSSASSIPQVMERQVQRQTPIPGLDLGPVVGKGSFGTVYRGRYKGQSVAVKVCTGALQQGRGRTNKPWAGVEAAMSLRLDHASVVRTFKHTVVLLQEGRMLHRSFEHGSGSAGSANKSGDWSDGWFDDEDDPQCQEAEAHNPAVEMEMWAIMEYCNRGTLQSGVDKGFFRRDRTSRPPSPPDTGAVIATALQLAGAMTYLHNQDIIHGDLAGGNILLTTDDSQPHGFSCKVADFGLSRSLSLQTRLMTASYGTVTHMPPELLTEGKLSKAADVYAFGVLIWEMATGVRAWAGMSHTQILAAVAVESKELCFLPGCDPNVVALARRCMARDPDARPTFPEIEDTLEQLDRQMHAANSKAAVVT